MNVVDDRKLDTDIKTLRELFAGDTFEFAEGCSYDIQYMRTDKYENDCIMVVNLKNGCLYEIPKTTKVKRLKVVGHIVEEE